MSYIVTGDIYNNSYINSVTSDGELTALIVVSAHIPENGLALAQQGLVFSQFSGGHNNSASDVVSELFKKSATLRAKAGNTREQVQAFYERFLNNFIQKQSVKSSDVDASESEPHPKEQQRAVEGLSEKIFYFRKRPPSGNTNFFRLAAEEDTPSGTIIDIYSNSGNLILSISSLDIDQVNDDLLKDCVVKTVNDITEQSMDYNFAEIGLPKVIEKPPEA